MSRSRKQPAQLITSHVIAFSQRGSDRTSLYIFVVELPGRAPVGARQKDAVGHPVGVTGQRTRQTDQFAKSTFLSHHVHRAEKGRFSCASAAHHEKCSV